MSSSCKSFTRVSWGRFSCHCDRGTVLLTRDAHSCEYDNNGNIVYVNTSRVKPDMTAQPDTVQRTREEKFRWDEENRLTALSQNGYVSHYWYDANGERDKRTVLCHTFWDKMASQYIQENTNSIHQIMELLLFKIILQDIHILEVKLQAPILMHVEQTTKEIALFLGQKTL